MPAGSENSAPSLVPLMRYRDVTTAVEWLCEAFGFERDVVVRERDGSIFYAQLRYGSGMVMLGGVREGDLDKLMRQPDEVGGAETQCCYLVVDDADAHYAKATAHGADIVLELKTDGLGRRGYSCRDPQGHIWNFGTYNPWKGKQAATDEPPKAMRMPAGIPARPAAAALLALILIIGAAMSWFGDSAPRQSVETTRADRIEERVAEAVAVAERGFRKDLAETRSAKLAAEQSLAGIRDALARERSQREGAEQTAEALRADLARMQADKATAERAADAAREDLKRVQSSGPGKAAGVSPADLQRERTAREAAERAKAEAEAALLAERDAKIDLEKELEEARHREAKQAAQLETSATAAAVEAALEKSVTQPAAASSVVAARPGGEAVKPQPRVPRRKAQQQQPLGPPPTYVTGLSDVPWPYNVWYEK